MLRSEDIKDVSIRSVSAVTLQCLCLFHTAKLRNLTLGSPMRSRSSLGPELP